MIIKNKKNYKSKYKKQVKKINKERIETLIKKNEEHKKNCSPKEQEILQIEIDTLKEELIERNNKQGKLE